MYKRIWARSRASNGLSRHVQRRRHLDRSGHLEIVKIPATGLLNRSYGHRDYRPTEIVGATGKYGLIIGERSLLGRIVSRTVLSRGPI